MKHTIKLLALSLFATSALILVKAPSVSAASLTVNSTDDTQVQDDGDCTLREAIDNINAGSDTTDGGGGGDCVAGDGVNDIIAIPAGTFTLASDLPTINKPVVVQGAGIGLTTIDGSGVVSAVLNASNVNGTGESVGIRGMTIRNFTNIGISASSSSLNASMIDVDGSLYGTAITTSGIVMINSSAFNVQINLENVYVHDLSALTAGNNGEGALGILAGALGDGNTTVVGQNLTVSNLRSNKLAIGFESFSGFDGAAGRVVYTIDNSTVTSIISTGDTAGGVVQVGVTTSDDVAPPSTLRNSTITGVRSQSGQLSGGAGVLVGTGAFTSGTVSSTGLNAYNLLLANNFSDGVSANCRVFDIGIFFGGSGTGDMDIISHGGSLSDDNTCSSYFSESTDHNNVSNISSTLGTLSNNGGYVPTIPLLQGSPAIDAGVSVTGLATDARLAIRPQGLAYDSGAYESPFTRVAVSSASLAATGQSATLLFIVAILTTVTGFVILSRMLAYSI